MPRVFLPIKVFETFEDLQACADYWVKQLQLESWKLKFYLVPQAEMPLEGAFGCNLMNYESNASKIYIIDKEGIVDGETCCDYCAEQTLVHELLHLRYNFLTKPEGSLPDVFWDIEEHRKLDQLATILVATKYGIRPSEV